MSINKSIPPINTVEETTVNTVEETVDQYTKPENFIIGCYYEAYNDGVSIVPEGEDPRFHFGQYTGLKLLENQVIMSGQLAEEAEERGYGRMTVGDGTFDNKYCFKGIRELGTYRTESVRSWSLSEIQRNCWEFKQYFPDENLLKRERDAAEKYRIENEQRKSIARKKEEDRKLKEAEERRKIIEERQKADILRQTIALDKITSGTEIDFTTYILLHDSLKNQIREEPYRHERGVLNYELRKYYKI
jgi:hypothetical protein